jgi:HD-like signal output (HDOD) protein
MSGTAGWTFCSNGNLWFQCGCGAQLMLTKGRFEWFSPSLLLSPTADRVFRALKDREELPHLPASLVELQRVLRDQQATPAQIAEAVKASPFIALELLKLANNLKGARADSDKPMTSLDHAIVYVGRQSLAELARAAGLKTFKFRTRSFTADSFWKEAQLTAKIAEILARRFGPAIDPDECYLAGFLCNIGKVVAAICHPERTDELHKLVSTSKHLPHWRKAEAELGADDHATLGEIGAVIWGLPGFVRDAAAKHHHAPTVRRGRPPGLVDIVTYANQMTHWVLLAPNRIDEEVRAASARAFGLDDAGQQQLADELSALHKRQLTVEDSLEEWLRQAK